MGSTDLDNLLDMGFEKPRAELALKKGGNVQGAIDWLDKNQDKSWEELSESIKSAETDPSIEPDALQEGEVAKSMVCNDCGKKFRSLKQAEVHAEHTEHTNFSESTDEIAPLTEEEKKQKLEELRAKMLEKKAKQAIIDKEEQKKNEKIRMKATKEVQDAKEELQKQEQIKAAAKKRQEKLDDLAAKRRIQEKIAADKEARRLKAEAQKAEREGRAPPPDPSAAAAQAQQAHAAPAVKKEVTEARLRLQFNSQTMTKTFAAETTLFEVAQALESDFGGQIESFTMTFPRKTFSGSIDFGKTLKEAGLLPSAVLIVK